MEVGKLKDEGVGERDDDRFQDDNEDKVFGDQVGEIPEWICQVANLSLLAPIGK